MENGMWIRLGVAMRKWRIAGKILALWWFMRKYINYTAIYSFLACEKIRHHYIFMEMADREKEERESDEDSSSGDEETSEEEEDVYEVWNNFFMRKFLKKCGI